MTLYDLTRAMVRYRKFVFGALAFLLVIVFAMMFSFGSGGIQVRGNDKFESEVQIAVISPTTSALIDTETADGLAQAADLYADLLSSAEAAVAVGEMAGYTMEETMAASVGGDSTLIVNKVIGPSFDLATAAALDSFEWLGERLQQPLTVIGAPTTTLPPSQIVLSRPFDARFTVEVAQTLGEVATELFVKVAVDSGEQITIPITQTAGSSIVSRATLSPITTLTMTLETADGTVEDVLRVAPVPPPQIVDAYPSLSLTFEEGAIGRVTTDDVPGWAFDEGNVSVEWIEGVVLATPETAAPEPVKIALVTTEPQAVQIGGRRGPLLGLAALFVGLIAIVTAVIVADTWRRERLAANQGIAESSPQSPTEPTEKRPPRRTRRKAPQPIDPEEPSTSASPE